MKIQRFFKIYSIFTSQYLKRIMEYRFDFITGLIGFFFIQIIGILFIQVVFEQIPDINGWSYYEILFIYGFAQIPRGLDHLLTDNLWFLSFNIVVKGEFDRYLLRPINPLFQLLSEVFQPDAFGELIVGIVLLSISIVKLNISFSILNIFLLIISIIAGTVIYPSIKLIFASLSFWFKDSRSVMHMVYSVSDFAKYPVTIYGKVVQFIICYIIPFGFTAFFPAAYFVNKLPVLFAIGGTVMMSLIFACLSYWIWLQGINKYESAGS